MYWIIQIYWIKTSRWVTNKRNLDSTFTLFWRKMLHVLTTLNACQKRLYKRLTYSCLLQKHLLSQMMPITIFYKKIDVYVKSTGHFLQNVYLILPMFKTNILTSYRISINICLNIFILPFIYCILFISWTFMQQKLLKSL